MSNLPQTTQIKAISIIPPGATGNQRSRLHKFATWLTETEQPWDAPDLASYRDHLLEEPAVLNQEHPQRLGFCHLGCADRARQAH